MSAKRIIVAANRLPVTITVDEVGFHFKPSPGGLASALGSLNESHELLWLGWPGEVDPESVNTPSLKEEIRKEYNAVPILLNRRQLKRYYFGFSNRVLWPVLHYLPVYVQYDERDYQAYRDVNRIFADEIIAILKKGGPKENIVWIHDYHLFLVPAMVRQAFPEAKIGFFLHTPFPSSEMFRTLPYREELLRGMLGSSLIGFHTHGYLRHFRSSCLHILGIRSEINRIHLDTHQVRIGAFPISIDLERIQKTAHAPEREEDLHVVRQITHGRRMILSVDRMDYTKGLPERLLAYKKFLQRNPRLVKEVVLVQIAVPSRTRIPDYQHLKDRVEQIVLDIEEAFENEAYPPIHFMYRSLPFARLSAFYREADVAMVTPFFDGMNLVAKEYVAVKKDRGVLILSEHAGAAAELGEALIINPWNPDQISSALEDALSMSPTEKARRMSAMYEKVSRNDVHYWSSSFLSVLESLTTHDPDAAGATIPVGAEKESEITERFRAAEKRLIALDYDGTLMDIASIPINARPDPDILNLLKDLCDLPDTHVVIDTGRTRREITEWLGHLNLGFSAEHGLWIKFPGEGDWNKSLAEDHNMNWYQIVRQIFHQFNLQTPGAFTEEKEASITWHYRLTDPSFGRWQSRELVMHLNNVLANEPLEVVSGKMIVEVRQHGVNKGSMIHRAQELDLHYDFQLGIGDDSTDESLFTALAASPEKNEAYTIRVGAGVSHAQYRLKTVQDVRRFLANLVESMH